MSEVSNHNWQDNSEQPVTLPTSPSWEAQLHTRVTELYAQRNAPLRAEIERLQAAFNEISARLVEQTTAAVSEQETAGLLDHVKQWFSDSRAKAEEDFQTRLAQARQEAEQDFESRLAELRSEWAAQRPDEAAAAQADNFELLKTALEEIDTQRTQSATLTALLRHAAQFAPRVAFFVVKGDEAVGWKASGFENGLNDETVKLLNVPTEQPTLLREALTSAQAAVGRAETPGENSSVLGSYGSPAPALALAIPLVVRGKAAAVLYADSGTQSETAINSAALETLLHATSMSIELLPVRRGFEPPARPVAPQPVTQAAAAALAPTPMSEQPAPTADTISEADSRAEVASPYERRMDASPTNPFAPEAEPAPTAETEPAPAPVVTTERTTNELPQTAEAESAVEMEAPAPNATAVEAEPATAGAAPAAESVQEEIDESSAPTLPNAPRPLLVKPPSQPTPFDSFASPSPRLPSGREERARFTPAAPAPMRPPQPISTPRLASETEQRAHNDARRFARLLVSEIKLYNATKVNEGRRSLDLYERLRDEIDRSRKVYDKRVAPAVAARFDYFYDELVQTLAEGDAVKLGANCPGPVVLSS